MSFCKDLIVVIQCGSIDSCIFERAEDFVGEKKGVGEESED